MRDVTFDNSIIYYINMDTDYLEDAVTMAMSLNLKGSIAYGVNLWKQTFPIYVESVYAELGTANQVSTHFLTHSDHFLLVIG